MAIAAPDDEDKALMKRALEKIEPLHSRISALLMREASPGTARVTTKDRVRSRWKLMEMELSAMLAALRRHLALSSSGAHRIVDDEDDEDMQNNWMAEIRMLASLMRHLLDRYERPPPCHAVLLHRAARCCCRRTTTAKPVALWWIEYIRSRLAFVAQHPFTYKHLLLVGDDTASTSSRTYHHLPYWLKLLLLYMVSMFPQGYKFDKNRLIWKWTSEGLTGEYFWFVNRYRKAEEYFSELVDREVIVQPANHGHKPAAEAEDCRWQVNPDMLQFLASESADKGFVCTSGMLNSAAGGDSDSTEILRRLSLHQPDPELPTLLETMDLSHTRSLAVSGAVDRIPLGKFIYLTVLDLEGWENLKDEDLRQQICRRMLLLRYLSVRNTGVTRLPPEIKKLRHLEALDVSHTQISELPPEIKELRLHLEVLDVSHTKISELPPEIKELRLHLEVLDVSHTKISELPPEIKELRLHLEVLDVSHTKISELPPKIKELFFLEALDVSHTNISKLPPEACKLPWLRTLDLRSTQVRQLPEQVVKLRNLRSLLVGGDGINPNETVAKVPEGIVRTRQLCVLASVDLSEWSARSVEALGGLWNLEVLAITWSFHQCADGRYRDALRSSIKKWDKLRSLTIHCGLGCSMQFLGSLDSPPKKLENFKITTGRFVTVPQWIKGLKHLCFLQITVCKLGTDDLKILGELPKLQRLVLGLDFLPGEAIVIRSEGFSQLRTFLVHCLVPSLTFGEAAMPELTYLDLEIICSVPPNQEIVLSGIGNLEKLREVVLRYSKWYSDSSSVKKTVQVVKNAVAEHPNPIELVINGTQHGVHAEAVDEETARTTTTEIQSQIEIESEIESEAHKP